MRRPSLRWMMLVPTLVTITVGFAIFAIYLDRVQHENLVADVDDELVRAERSSTVRAGSTEVGPGPPPEAAIDPASEPELADDVDPPVQLLLGSDGRVLAEGGGRSPFDRSTLADLADRNGTFTLDDLRYRVRATPGEDGTVWITALSLDRLDDTVADFRRTLLGGGVVILMLEASVVWFLTAGLARPVTRMAATATLIADGAIDTEIDPPRGSREIAELADDLDRMVHQLRSTIRERERSADDATRARDDMQRFLADVSHELRTPLTSLKGYSDLYAGNMLDEPGALDRAMSRIGDESERLNLLVTDMLELARQAPAGTETERVDLLDIVEVVVDDLRAAHPEVPIDLDVAQTTNTVTSGQPGPLHQAILNVGSNACHHTRPGTGIGFRMESTAADLLIHVSDHGPGIDPDQVEKIFLPFYRDEASRGRDGRGGAGLGLAITNQIMQRHGGSVTVGANPTGGAVFTLAIPLQRPKL